MTPTDSLPPTVYRCTPPMAQQPPELRRQVSSELTEATSLLLHASLEIHLPPGQHTATPIRRRGNSSAGLDGRARRRKSVEDLRVPPDYKGASEGRAGSSNSSGLASGSQQSGAAGRADGGASEVQHPFAGSQHLLRRATSVEDLLARDEPGDEEEELDDGFTSDVSGLTMCYMSHR